VTSADAGHSTEHVATGVIGREQPLARLAALGMPAGPEAILLVGAPGMGKTTLWEAGIRAAEDRRVLIARPGEAEADLSFAVLIDLFTGVADDELTCLPSPQRRALEAALLRRDPPEGGAALPVIHVAALGALRALAARDPLLVAVDDVQWADPLSAATLAFAARRAEGIGMRFLLARRPGVASPVERALERRGLERLDVGPLSAGAIRRLLGERLGLRLGRRHLGQIADATQGNPFFALELGRGLAEHGLPAPGEEIPVPDEVEDLLGLRVRGLPPGMRRLLLAFALHGELRPDQIASLAGPDALDEAVDAGLVVIDEARARASHPLLPAAARKRSRPGERRDLHLALAGLSDDRERRLLHLAVATDAPDEALAADLAAAAGAARARGAVPQAARLAEHALRLSRPESAARVNRLLDLCTDLSQAGERHRVAELLVPELDTLPRGTPYGQACLLLSSAVTSDTHGWTVYVERGLAESGTDQAFRAHALAELAANQAVTLVERIPEADAMALEALEAAPPGDADPRRHALYVVAWTRALSGRPIEDLVERFRETSDEAFYVVGNPGRVAGQRHVWRGEIARAREFITPLLALADEQGEPISYGLMRLHLCELELRLGNWEAAASLLDEWAEDREGELLAYPMDDRCRALLWAGRGLPAEAEAAALRALARADEIGVGWDRLEALRALGQAALVRTEPARAVEHLRPVWEHTEREGVTEPGVFPVAPDLVEALVEQGAADEAARISRRLADLAEAQDHPWARITAARCAAIVRLASPGYDEQAAEALTTAAADYAAAGLRFDLARSLLVLGRWQRRLRKWGAGRRTLEAAVAAFDGLGSHGWAEQARSELARVGARRPKPSGELTQSEQRVAELAATGLSNKEIARTLFVTVNTVEAHLSHAYAKLGVRSRGQLTSRLARPPG
jgi:DNA-binding NarL/FixJ family response regulator